MTVAQLKLSAIRARLNGVFDHPALMYFGALGDMESDIRMILDTYVPESDLAGLVATVDALSDE